MKTLLSLIVGSLLCLEFVEAQSAAPSQRPSIQPRRLAVIDVESEFLADDEKAKLLTAFKSRLSRVDSLQRISEDEIASALVQPNTLKAEVQQVRDQHQAKKQEILQQLEDGKRYFLDSQFSEAITILEGALLSLNSAALALTADIPSNILIYLAASHFFQGDESDAKSYLGALLDLDTTALLESQKFPPPFIELFNQVRSSPRYQWKTATISSDVKDIKFYFLGFPLPVPQGQPLVLSLPSGHPLLGSKAVIAEAADSAPVAFTPDQIPSNLKFVSTLDRRASTAGLFAPIGLTTASPELKRILGGVRAEITFLGQVKREESGILVMTAQWLEQPSGRVSPVVQGQSKDPSQLVEAIASELFEYLSPEGLVVEEKFVPSEEREQLTIKEPFYTTWWFWTLVGVAGVGVGAGTYLLLNQDSSVNVSIRPAP